MPNLNRYVCSAFALVCTLASGEEAVVLRDLDAKGRVTLTRDELSQLLPSANMSRVSGKGTTNFWKNDPSGTFIISSDNRATSGQTTTSKGKWHISEDGRYCVLIEWKRVQTEEWCRFIVKSGSAHYATKSDRTGTEKVYRLYISP